MVEKQIAPPRLCRRRGAGRVGVWGLLVQLPTAACTTSWAARPAAAVPSAPGSSALGWQAGTCLAPGAARPFSLGVWGGSGTLEWLYLLNLPWPGLGLAAWRPLSLQRGFPGLASEMCLLAGPLL